jgi:ACS family hexuronate transporter-like MFS transporter
MVSSSPARAGYVRWVICGLLFLAATVNYVDRQVIGILKPTLQADFNWTETDYANIIFAFQLAYAVGYIFAGRVIDWLGTKRGFTLAILIWSAAAVGHAEAPLVGGVFAPILNFAGFGFSTSVAGFIVMRFLLGLGESGNFPAAIKTVAEWFPIRERALATGIFNSGTNVGALIAPIIVPVVTIRYGWYWAFVITGIIGLGWVLAWWLLYAPPAEHPRLSAAERRYITSDATDTARTLPWRKVVPHRAAWAFAIGKFLTDPVWWLYLFWIPDFLNRNYGVDLTHMGPPLIAIYFIADIGSVVGGWLSSALIGRGWSVNAARKTAMLVMALAVVPIVFASSVQHLWVAVALVGLAAAAHQGWSANLFTLTSDTFPRSAVGSVVGFGGMCGAIGGMLISKVTGYLLDTSGSYVPVFIMAGGMYLVALAIIHLLVPRLEPVRLE